MNKNAKLKTKEIETEEIQVDEKALTSTLEFLKRRNFESGMSVIDEVDSEQIQGTPLSMSLE